MRLEQFFTVISQIATWITILLVYFTLREMQKQRRMSTKPHIIITESRGNLKIRKNQLDSYWDTSNSENSFDEVLDNKGNYLQNAIKINFHNIGLGVAKNIVISWQYNLESNIKIITEYCNKYDLDIPVLGRNENNDFIAIKYKKIQSYFNILFSKKSEYTYLLTDSVKPDGLEVPLPLIYQTLLSLHFDVMFSERLKDNKIAHVIEGMNPPTLKIELDYNDVSGLRYSQRFEIFFHSSIVDIPDDKEIYDISGYFEIKQIK